MSSATAYEFDVLFKNKLVRLRKPRRCCYCGKEMPVGWLARYCAGVLPEYRGDFGLIEARRRFSSSYFCILCDDELDAGNENRF